MNTIRVFPFFYFISTIRVFSFFSSIKEGTRKMENCNVSHILDRRSHQRCSVRKGVLRNFSKCTGKHRVRVSSLIKLQALGRWYRRVTANFAKFFKNIFFQNTSGSLVLFRLNRISDIMQEASIQRSFYE